MIKLNENKEICNTPVVSGGFARDTEVWCSAGFYKTIEKLAEKKEFFMTDSFDEDQIAFVVNRAAAVKSAEECELVEVTFGPSINLGNNNREVTVRCAPWQKFLMCYENNGTLHYKGNETFFWVEAKDLKEGRRLVAEDANIVVKSIKKIKEKAKVYNVTVESCGNFSIKLGVIVKGERL